MPYNKRKITLALIFSVTLASALGLASVTPALPKIAKALSVGEGKIGLVFAIFALPSLILTPILGGLADKFGRKTILIPSLLLFATAGFACTFAPDFNTLLILRFFQGCGASSLGALNVTLIGDLFAEKERPTIMGFNNSVLSIGTGIFPILGGALAGINWNYTFLLPLLGLPVGLLVIKYLENTKSKSSTNFRDYSRSVLTGLKNLKVQGILLFNFGSFMLLFGCFLNYTPFVINSKFTSSSFKIGLIIASMSVFQALISMILGRLVGKFSKKLLIVASFISYSISMIMIPFMPSLIWLLVPTFFFGLAHGINIPVLQSILAGTFGTSNRAAFMSLNRMVAQSGQFLGPLIMGLIFSRFGLNIVFITGSIASLTMLIPMFFYFKRNQIRA